MVIERTPPVAIDTPCIGVCVMEPDGLCRGCARTIDEIVAWGQMTPDRRRAIMATLSDRRT